MRLLDGHDCFHVSGDAKSMHERRRDCTEMLLGYQNKQTVLYAAVSLLFEAQRHGVFVTLRLF